MKSKLNVTMTSAILLSSCLALVCSAQSGDQAAQKSGQKPGQKVTIGTSEVVLDVIVRDKKGKPVRDLAGSDFEVYEDGVKQDIQSFRVQGTQIGEGPPESPGASKERMRPTAPNPFAGLGVVALVFDRLTPNAREAAHKAALSYVSSIGKNDMAGVFRVDLSLQALQPFTNNTDLLTKAVERAAALSSSGFPTTAEQSANITQKLADLLYENPQSSAGNGTGQGANLGPGGAPSNPQAMVEIKMLQMTKRILEGFESLERDEQGYATTNALLGVVNSLKQLEGRKAIIFFSEGVAIPPAVAIRFQSVISAANQANVSIYPVDAAGLRVDSTLAATQRQQDAIVKTRMASQETGAEDTSGRPMTRDLERNEDVLRLDPHSGLGQLADQTGGFDIADTNNLKSGLARIDEDLRFHYVLSYVPKNSDYDGKFRRISVKLSKTALDVQTRKGYYALPGTGDSPVLDYEAPALVALANAKATDNPSLHARAFSFPDAQRPGLLPILVDIPGKEFTYEVDKEKNTYKSDFTILAVVRDQADQTVTKVSQHFQMTGPADKLESAKAAEVLFYREAQAPPGKYSIEAVTYDSPSGKSYIRTSQVDVAAPDPSTLRMSSVAIMRRVEHLSAADKKMDNPFHYKEVLIYPNLGAPLIKSTAKQVAFFCTVYPARGATTAPSINIKVLSEGNVVFDRPGTLAAADANGRIQFAGALPLEAFPPGSYELQLAVTDGHTSISRSATFTVQP